MKTKIEKLLSDARTFREQGRFAESLANLHQVVNAVPTDLRYKYLLASTYFEAENIEAAKKYAKEVIDEDKKSKEALELSGLICVKEGKYKEAEDYYKQALRIDPDFHNARMKLILLDYEFLKSYEEMEKHCKYMLDHRDIDRETLPPKSKYKILINWYNTVITGLIHALANQAKYEEAIHFTNEYIQFLNSSLKRPRKTQFLNQYANIYKFIYLMNDKERLKAYKKELTDFFSDVEDFGENDFKFWEDLAKQNSF